MFSKFFRRGDGSARSARSPGSGSSTTPRSLATYDTLGQALVATLTVDTLTGPDAVQLVAELAPRIRGGGAAKPAEGEGVQPAPTVRHVVLDLHNVQYMDSMCIGVLVELMTAVRDAGGRIAIVNSSQNVEYLFKLTRLDRVFVLCRDVMKAIEAVERGG